MDLTTFEAAVYGRDHKVALRLLPNLLLTLAREGLAPLVRESPERWKPKDRAAAATRLAAAVGAFLVDPACAQNPEGLLALLPLAGAIDSLFMASAFGSPDPFLKHLLDHAPPNQIAPAHLLLFSLASETALPTELINTLPPPIRWEATLRLLGTKVVTSPAAAERKNVLLEACGTLALPKPRGIDSVRIVSIANAGMLSSYATSPMKHAIKATLGAAAREAMISAGIRDAELPTPRIVSAERPVLVVASEMIHARHVQYRYFGQWFRQLRKRFRLVLVTDKNELDPHARSLFDESLGFERREDCSHVKQARDIIVAQKPDVVFYPSVGMRHWGIALASLRLAPIQATALGHSASTFLPSIDYYVIERGYVSDPSLFSEKLILLPDSALSFEPMPGIHFPTPDRKKHKETIRIGIPSNALKLTSVFLATLKRIVTETKRPTEVHVFPNVGGLEEDALRASLDRWIPGIHVHGMMPYEAYLDHLAACDLILSPFPFGGLHSIVDAVRLGTPVVAMDGLEPHSRTDGMVLRLLGLAQGQVHTSENDYVATALSLIEDDERRWAASQASLAANAEKKLFGDDEASRSAPVLDAFLMMLNDHEKMQASHERAWSVR